MSDLSKVLLFSNHHRRSLFFEDSCRRLWNSGFKNLLIQSTGAGEMSEYHGPHSAMMRSGPLPYDTGMMRFKQKISGENYKNIKTMVLIDNDLFFSQSELLQDQIRVFEEQDYDFASYFVGRDSYQGRVKADKYFCQVEDQAFEPSDVFPYFVPIPHWENAKLIIKKKMWDKLSEDDVSHGRKFLKALSRENARMAAYHVNHKGSHSHHAEDFFHVGALFQFYHWIERQQFVQISPEGEFSLYRVGYFAAQEECYGGGIYPSGFASKLESAYARCGGRDKVLEAWRAFTRGTVMENWTPT